MSCEGYVGLCISVGRLCRAGVQHLPCLHWGLYTRLLPYTRLLRYPNLLPYTILLPYPRTLP